MKYFTINELVSPTIIEVIGEKSAWHLIDPVIQTNLDALRKALGMPIRINGGGFTNSGVRPCNTSVGASRSHHKPIYGDDQAFDLKCNDMDALWELVLTRHKEFNIIRVEKRTSTPSWLHAEFATKYSDKELILFKP